MQHNIVERIKTSCTVANVNKDCFHFLTDEQKELAELSGMSTESVIRTLKHFQEDGLIKITGKHFEVIDPEGLQKICLLG